LSEETTYRTRNRRNQRNETTYFALRPECLICTYYPTEGEPTQEEVYARRFDWTAEEVSTRLKDERPVSPEEAQKVAEAIGQDPGMFFRLVGRPFAELLHAQCGFIVPSEGDRAVAPPIPHVPVLAAVLLATDFLALHMEDVNRPAQRPARVVFDGLGMPTDVKGTKYPPHPDCICRESDYQETYHELWPED
jgi:hypothetical protein